MRILHICDEIWDSGLTNYALTLLTEQVKSGHTAAIAALEDGYLVKKARESNLPVIPISKKITRLLPSAKKIAAFAPQIINAHTGSGHSLGAVAKKLCKVPPVLIRTRADARPFEKKLFSTSLWEYTDAFIAANKTILNDFQKHLPQKLARVVMQGIAPCPDLPAGAEPFTLGIAARLDAVKGHKTAITALFNLARKFPKIKIRCAGREENIKIKELTDYAAHLGVEYNIEFLGYVEDIRAFMQSCAAGIAPSLGSEAVSRAVLEWYSCGKPVIASAVGIMPEIIEDGKSGFLVPPSDPQILANAAIKLLEDDSLRFEMGQNARKLFYDKFTSAVFARNTEDFYRRIMFPQKENL